IKLTKRIPVRAGLGGGSSDGAAALHAVNTLAGNAVPRHELLHFAAKLGADVAFFAGGAALAVAWGRGERQFRLPAPPSSPVLLAVPSIQVATPDAYAWWDEQNRTPAPRGPVTLDPDALSTWGSIGRLGGNDFETVVFGKRPELRSLFERVAETGPVWVRLCGSGSTIAAVQKEDTERENAVQRPGEIRLLGRYARYERSQRAGRALRAGRRRRASEQFPRRQHAPQTGDVLRHLYGLDGDRGSGRHADQALAPRHRFGHHACPARSRDRQAPSPRRQCRVPLLARRGSARRAALSDVVVPGRPRAPRPGLLLRAGCGIGRDAAGIRGTRRQDVSPRRQGFRS